MLEYYRLLRNELRKKECYRECRARCRHCGIFFIAHRRNKGRKDLGCPFGCREFHRKKNSNERSVEFYRGPEGKIKKQLQNEKRRKSASKEPIQEIVPAKPVDIPHTLFSYLQMVISLIEARQIRAKELKVLIARIMRQPSIAQGGEKDYKVVSPREHPP